MPSNHGHAQPLEPPDDFTLVSTLRANDLSALHADTPTCPVCRREDALVLIGETIFCAACGYSSDGSRGCT